MRASVSLSGWGENISQNQGGKAKRHETHTLGEKQGNDQIPGLSLLLPPWGSP